ncbi:uncharacterized protein F4807DRAFT_460194 [Annulohypoxylon truncatum]|uniref:uncharacterized protein n=1 Tax=Annulohypoxylon truncatum TaxID=327061 RepID=UPI002008098B|nr:uncharacterized protein F4807DRAFT_460194 [Annulohypoxylon truncatum]KAI1209901.1 hypothetical protein F4807DRAFT_460194 [Annulohypoxylon truncatum]
MAEQDMNQEQDGSNRSDSSMPSFSSIPQTQPPSGSLLDAAINQLLRERPSQVDSNYTFEYRELRDINLVQHAPTECKSGDTLIIVNFPQGYKNCKWKAWSSKRFHAHSKNLLATGSKVFAHLFSPEEQARIRKRVGDSLPQKYVLDLTPSVEGDELAAQLIELSLPPGVRDWWTSKERLGIPQYLVSGHDDHCPLHTQVLIGCQKTDKYVEHQMGREEELPKIDLAHITIPESRIILDYCPIRHRANIIRLILAIQGHDLVLNSAPRVYTLTGIAHILDCTSIIRDSVYTWLMTESNTEFIDINAEAAFKMAWTLELANVTRAAFRILVVERAFDTLSIEPRAEEARYTIFGRPRVDLPDDLQTVVQYAALKLVERVQQTLGKLKSDQFYDLLEISEYQKLVRTGELILNACQKTDQPGHTEIKELSGLCMALLNKLLEYKTRIVHEAMATPLCNNLQRDYDRDRRCYIPETSWNPTSHIYSKFSDAQRLLTPNFWEELASYPYTYTRACYPDQFLGDAIDRFNTQMDKALHYLPATGRHFNLAEFRKQLNIALEDLWVIWTKPNLETPLTRTRHMLLALSEDEFQYLPLWAGGLDDGTGGVFEPTVPDADLGPIGPGPAYRTGETVATDCSSICQSDKTPSDVSTVTLTAGRSLAAVHSNAVPTTVNDGVSTNTMSTSSIVMVDEVNELDDESDDAFEFDDSDEISEEAWSQVEEP